MLIYIDYRNNDKFFLFLVNNLIFKTFYLGIKFYRVFICNKMYFIFMFR